MLLGQSFTDVEPLTSCSLLGHNIMESQYLVSTLIHVTGSVVVDPQHWNKPVGISICLQRHRKTIDTEKQLPEEMGLHFLHVFQQSAKLIC